MPGAPPNNILQGGQNFWRSDFNEDLQGSHDMWRKLLGQVEILQW